MASVVAAADTISRWVRSPAAMVRELFDATPDPWQIEVLERFPHCQRQAMVACKGPGKTTVLAWLIWNFLLTRPHPKIAATSITEGNIDSGLWPELAKWQARAPILKENFEWTKSRVSYKAAPENWFCIKRTWSQSADPQEQAATLAGFHADYVMFVLDESGGMPEAIAATAEAALATGVECHLIQAGNPTTRTGPLFRAATSERHLWHVVNITGDPDDPKRSSRVSKQWAQEQISRWGRDDPFVLVNVFGVFPPVGLNQLIGEDEIAEATKRVYRTEDIASAAKVCGVDVARFGDDASVLWPRQGLQAFHPKMWRNLNSVQGAAVVAEFWRDWQPDAVFVDDTGGFGAGWLDQLRVLNFDPIGVPFSGKAIDDERYANKRVEMYFEAVKWIRAGGSLPDITELSRALVATTYTFERAGRGRMIIEPKDQIKLRLGFSPDHADAFCLSFGGPVQKKPRPRPGRGRHQVDFNPYEALWNSVDHQIPRLPPQHRIEYDCYAEIYGASRTSTPPEHDAGWHAERLLRRALSKE